MKLFTFIAFSALLSVGFGVVIPKQETGVALTGDNVNTTEMVDASLVARDLGIRISFKKFASTDCSGDADVSAHLRLPLLRRY